MTISIEHRLYTMYMVQNGDHVLLIKRPDSRGFPSDNRLSIIV
ncbi:hypothetical protein [Fictibacillus norfolkensis]|nr:hypothetical protein [Fictibacillus norfolkensis]